MDIIVNSDVFNSVSIPKRPVISCEIIGNFCIRRMSDNAWNFNKQRNPIILWWGSCAGSLEVFSVNVEFSITNVNKNVKLVFSFWSKQIVFWFIHKSDISSIFMKSWICSFNFVESKISELRKNVFIGLFKSFVWVEVNDFTPVIKINFLWFWIEDSFINL